MLWKYQNMLFHHDPILISFLDSWSALQEFRFDCFRLLILYEAFTFQMDNSRIILLLQGSNKAGQCSVVYCECDSGQEPYLQYLSRVRISDLQLA